ncbi:hypothetical protein QN379_14345, partial [Glaciimonas sp. Gout2]|uniref:hypothetical protein n=1 Tax=Glaciimonas sp. Gout2 TaxID=3048625 RepID=UPI002B23C520
KRLCADDSAATSVKVGHRQALIRKPSPSNRGGFLLCRNDLCNDNTQHPTPNTQHPTPNTLSTFNLEISGRRARPRDAASRLPPLCCLNALFFDVDQRISATSLPLLPTQDNRQQWVQFE